VAGGKLKEIGLDHWQSPNVGATDEFGFTSLPGGFSTTYNISNIPDFVKLGFTAYYWSSTEQPDYNPLGWMRGWYH